VFTHCSHNTTFHVSHKFNLVLLADVLSGIVFILKLFNFIDYSQHSSGDEHCYFVAGSALPYVELLSRAKRGEFIPDVILQRKNLILITAA